MKIDTKQFRVPPAKAVDLEKWPTLVKPFYKSKAKYGKMLAEHVEQLSSLQRLHYASDRYALLLIFQAMDDDVELRRVRITNGSSRRRAIELTSYGEIVLAPPATDAPGRGIPFGPPRRLTTPVVLGSVSAPNSGGSYGDGLTREPVLSATLCNQ